MRAISGAASLKRLRLSLESVLRQGRADAVSGCYFFLFFLLFLLLLFLFDFFFFCFLSYVLKQVDQDALLRVEPVVRLREEAGTAVRPRLRQ